MTSMRRNDVTSMSFRRYVTPGNLPPPPSILNRGPPNILNLPMPTVKILKIGTPEIITIIVLQLEQLDFTVQYCVQKMQTE